MRHGLEVRPDRSGAEQPAPRIATLDVLRGAAVMGILAMNVVGFGLPFQAYMNPAALGPPDAVDTASWSLSFVLFDGKMRGLFSFLFGASALLVIERAEAAGLKGASVHFRRMAWLLFFGLVHFYLIWSGDILISYALIGMAAFMFRSRPPEKLVALGLAFLSIQLLLIGAMSASVYMLAQAAAAPGAEADLVRQWLAMEREFGILSPAQTAQEIALYQASYPEIVRHRLVEDGAQPLTGLLLFGWETLAYMLFGMAGLKSGFLTGDWKDRTYRRVAWVGFGIGIPAYAALAWAYAASGFDTALTFALVMAATTPLRPPMIAATAALVILLARRAGPLHDRIAATGRVAFSNYLGTSILMTVLFYGYGLGLFGTLGRAELWLVVIATWALMLAWSTPWLDRFEYGPLEWLWRSLARWQVQPLRKSQPA